VLGHLTAFNYIVMWDYIYTYQVLYMSPLLQDGGTALTVASSYGNVQIVEELLKRNADTDLHKEVSENLLH